MEASTRGLDRARELCHDRTGYACEMSEQGKKVIGYFCCYTPVELMTALDLVPYRIVGQADEPVREADAYLETSICSYVRSAFDLAIRGEYDFLNGLVVPHTCDAMWRILNIWKFHKPLDYSYFIEVPHMVGSSACGFLEEELRLFKKSLEQLADRVISEDELCDAIDIQNRARVLMRELYQYRKLDPPLISGVEIAEVMTAGSRIPVAEFNELLLQVIHEIRTRGRETRQEKPRLLIYGAEVDDPALIGLIEECGANVVMDDLCTGSRSFWEPVKIQGDALRSLAAHYVNDMRCPRTCLSGRPDERFRYLVDFAREFNVQGIILYMYRFCDGQALEAPALKAYLVQEGFPVLHLEEEYTLLTTGQLRTRFQTFIETLS
jgi:bzd-type benzoyl-CoA reductase N subunit